MWYGKKFMHGQTSELGVIDHIELASNFVAIPNMSNYKYLLMAMYIQDAN